MIQRAAVLFGRATGLVDDNPDSVLECRRCGRAVETTDAGDPPEECPDCGPDGDLIRHDLV